MKAMPVVTGDGTWVVDARQIERRQVAPREWPGRFRPQLHQSVTSPHPPTMENMCSTAPDMSNAARSPKV